jgi:predicted outer membrane repeat protein
MTLLVLVASFSARAADFTVNRSLDTVDAAPGDGVCEGPAGGCSLRAAVMEANALPGRDRVLLGEGTFTLTRSGGPGVRGGDVDILEDLDVIGSGSERTVINGGLTRIFFVDTSGTSTFTGLTLQNGVAPLGEDGGCALALTSTVWDDVVFRACAAENGGGLAATDVVEVYNASFERNTAASEGGGLWVGADAVLDAVSFVDGVAVDGSALVHGSGGAAATLFLTGLFAAGNTTTGGWNPVIRSRGTVLATDLVLQYNDSPGGIEVDRSLDADGIVVRESAYDSAAIQVHSSELLIRDVLIVTAEYGVLTSDWIDRIVVQDLILVDTVTFGLRARADVVSVANVSGSRCGSIEVSSNGGTASDLSLNACSLWLGGEVALTDLLLTNQSGFGVYPDANVHVSRLELRDYREQRDSGLRVLADGVVTFEDSYIHDNDVYYCGYCYSDVGGAVTNEGTATFVRTRFRNNGAYWGGGAIYANNGSLTLIDSQFIGNGSDYGGAIFHGGLTSSLVVDGCTFTDNGAGEDGGAIYLVGGGAVIERSAFIGNEAHSYGSGGAVAGSFTGDIRSSTFINNTAGRDGSAIAFNYLPWDVVSSSMVLDGVTVTDNDGGGSGAVYVGDRQTVTVRNSILAANTQAGATPSDCAIGGSGVLVSDGNNLVGADCGAFSHPTDRVGSVGSPLDPVLGAPGLFGGPTVVVPPAAGSPALDGSDTCSATDQWGQPRPADGDGDGLAVCDIGAYEVQ